MVTLPPDYIATAMRRDTNNGITIDVNYQPRPNLGLLADVVKFLRNNPGLHDQGNWVTSTHWPVTTQQEPVNYCGTAACFAGWAFILSGHTVHDAGEYIASKAAALLGLAPLQAVELFDAGNSIDDIERIVERITSAEERRQLMSQGPQ
jgi:hypothetical protein